MQIVIIELEINSFRNLIQGPSGFTYGCCGGGILRPKTLSNISLIRFLLLYSIDSADRPLEARVADTMTAAKEKSKTKAMAKR